MQRVLRIDGLPGSAIDAAAEFHRVWLTQVRAAVAENISSLVLVMPAAPHDHRDWRLGLARDLAREAAPCRVNVLAGADTSAIAATLEYLERAPGVTGQLLVTDGQGAGNPAH
ncbi:Rossmann fold domain-containing protein [Allopontixanthobacter sediminis]|uniref:Short chain dehydrogenase-like proteobacteria domain-containing protein n=1 Tax=Allopontixanthobacter sediminis TaxID=1689985 RepID=A0A845B7P1_9SPHN|nr:hypothetical protein [Allopontixanthobacter sediminis]MXP45457.1 hypothetical protein [Allopontixanthobacter sediminis]